MSCQQHHLDNQGFCHTCGKPLEEGFDAWLVDMGLWHRIQHKDGLVTLRKKWQAKIDAWEEEHGTA